MASLIGLLLDVFTATSHKGHYETALEEQGLTGLFTASSMSSFVSSIFSSASCSISSLCTRSQTSGRAQTDSDVSTPCSRCTIASDAMAWTLNEPVDAQTVPDVSILASCAQGAQMCMA